MIATLVLFSFCLAIASGCTGTVTELLQLGNRSMHQNTFDTGGIVVDDETLEPGWFSSFVGGFQYLMADRNNIPQLQSCGSFYVIYINETHPDTSTMVDGDVVSTKACLVDIRSECSETYDIQIRKCNGEVQYYLVRTKSLAGYCFDLDFQNAEMAPTVEPGLYRDTTDINGYTIHQPYLTFGCSFEILQQYHFNVKWYVNNEHLITHGPSQDMADLNLDEQTLLDNNIKLGINLKCEVLVNNSQIEISMGASEDFFAGIKILNSTVYVTKESVFTVAFQLTVPIGCYQEIIQTLNHELHTCPGTAELALIDASTDTDTCNSGAQSYGYRCESLIETVTDIDHWSSSRVYTKEMVTTDVNYADADTITLGLIIDSDTTEHSIWKDYNPGSVTVIVTEIDYRQKLCYAKVDPHMRTADGILYEHQKAGDYLMYRNNAYDTEVQVRFGSCGSVYNRATCACAVTIRAGADIFEINICGTVRYIGFKRCEDGGILQIREKSDRKYQIHTPIGTIVEAQLVQLSSWYDVPVRTVSIKMAPKDLYNIVGLCGNFDNNWTNDLQKRDNSTVDFFYHGSTYYTFSDSWALLDEETLFDDNNYDKHGRWEDNNALFCYCNETSDDVFESVCSPVLDQDCAYTIDNDRTETLCTIVGNRKKRSLSSNGHILELKRRLHKHNTASSHHRIQKRQDNTTISETDANETCFNTIMYSAAAQLQLLNESDIQAAVNNCIFDIQEMNDLSYADIHVTLLTNAINIEIEKDPVYQIESEDAIIEFRQSSCDNNCSGNGNCSEEGLCVCFNVYHGVDCSVDERDALTIEDITGAGFCDTTMNTCECYDVVTLNLLENFYCRTQQVVVFTNQTDQLIQTSTYNGLRLSIFEGECCVPQPIDTSLYQDGFWVKYIVSISNDGITYSNNRTLHIFDGSCQNTTGEDSESANIVLNPDGCIIDGVCYTDNQTAVTDTCLMCKPNVNQYQWSNVCTDAPSTTVSTSIFNSVSNTITPGATNANSTMNATTTNTIQQTEEAGQDNNFPIIVASCAIGAIILAIVCGVVIYIKCKSKRPQPTASTSSNVNSSTQHNVYVAPQSTYEMFPSRPASAQSNSSVSGIQRSTSNIFATIGRDSFQK